MDNGFNRRDFIKAVGIGAGMGALALSSSCQVQSAFRKPAAGMSFHPGKTLRVQPALVYQFHQRREATSWRPWGGLHNQSDVDNEAKRIEQELKKMSAKSDFPITVQPVALVNNNDKAKSVGESDCDVILVYASGGWGELDTLAASGKPNIMFLRHQSGPVSLWYEIAHPHFLRRATDEYKNPNMDIWDIVVDDYDEVLWRLRALYGLKNALGTRIIAIGDAGGWGEGYKLGPETARAIWKLDIQPVSYQELEPMIKKNLADEKVVEQARREADEYLGQKGVSLHTDKKFLVNAFVLTKVFRELMTKADAPAITVNGCMGTIIPMAQTTACMPLSLINDSGLMAFCESDFVVIPSGILLRHISGKPVFLNDPTHPHDGMITIATAQHPDE
ncbi:MAG: twin-arginine translocation signal domain-containing protein [Sedimentisphaerales bacterium]|nr:twin-arginine translocation signal domain-containing protein [Sedimentisphaerales bacterium]